MMKTLADLWRVSRAASQLRSRRVGEARCQPDQGRPVFLDRVRREDVAAEDGVAIRPVDVTVAPRFAAR
jgi:hypothetical protein